MAEIPVIPSLPFVVSMQCRDRLADGVRSGHFVFPQSADIDAAVLGILADRCAIVEANTGLRDPLADLLPAAQDTTERLALLCHDEIAAARTMRQNGTSSERYNVGDFNAALIAARRAYGFLDVTRRRSAVRTDVPAGECSTRYPDPLHIPTLIEAAAEVLLEMDNDDVALSAAFAYCAAVHCHAFQDGNKRTARVLWSAMITQKGSDALPLALLSNINRRAFTIQFRRVILFGNWGPLLLYFLTAAEACHAWIRANAVKQSQELLREPI
jgi:hypothetical protein